MKIAMWSGPRNLSTAMMYAFGNRADTTAVDEPFYAAYLAATGLDHPMRDVILQAQSTDAGQVAQEISGSNLAKTEHLFLKLMALHMVDTVPTDWIGDCTNIHLIRHPARVIQSYAIKRERPNLDDIGFAKQWELYQAFPGPVIDSADIRRDPERSLRALCGEIGLEWDPAMLHWPKGPKPFDGIWASHWYGAAHSSTGFAGPEGELPRLEPDMERLAEAAMPFYEEISARKLSF